MGVIRGRDRAETGPMGRAGGCVLTNGREGRRVPVAGSGERGGGDRDAPARVSEGGTRGAMGGPRPGRGAPEGHLPSGFPLLGGCGGSLPRFGITVPRGSPVSRCLGGLGQDARPLGPVAGAGVWESIPASSPAALGQGVKTRRREGDPYTHA